ncbi:MAG TPA: COX15/CtaA family protein [Acidimicrobiales bacterium]|nr:COX15/CtaA family protein [Acidimicrobiales bacterium]
MTPAPRRRITLARYRRITLLALLALAVIVVSGAAVRLTGSGLGCEDWPRCTEERFVAEGEFHQLVEFLNRAFTGVVSVAVMLAVLGSLWLDQRRRDLTLWSLGLVAGVIGQIVLGGLVVLFHLSPWLVLGHFSLSMVLVWNAVVLHQRARGPAGPRASTMSHRLTLLTRGVVGLSMIVIFSGTIVTGSGPHSGAHGDQFVERLPFAVHTVARLHGAAMIAFLVATLALGWMLRPGARETSAADAPRARRDLSTLLTVLVAQAAIGYVQYFSDVPPLLVGIHVAGATTLWITMVWFYLRRFEPVLSAALRPELSAPLRPELSAPLPFDEVANGDVSTET